MKPVQNRAEQLLQLLRERIVILDGAMGTMVQQHKLDEAAYRGEPFKHSRRDLQGLHDLLCLTQPRLVEGIHKQYLEAGADCVYPVALWEPNALSQFMAEVDGPVNVSAVPELASLDEVAELGVARVSWAIFLFELS